MRHQTLKRSSLPNRINHIGIYGLWHLGSVLTSFLASKSFDVTATDSDPNRVFSLRNSELPIQEPGVSKLLARGNRCKKIVFTTLADKIHLPEVWWLTIDTPINHQDQADLVSVKKSIRLLFQNTSGPLGLIISSQVPVGFCREVAESFKERFPERTFHICYAPENLRIGSAISYLNNPDRWIVGVQTADDQIYFAPIFKRITKRIEWMGLESAEMLKHAINSFLATSIVFANEIAEICEIVGADAKDVARGLLSESRIGPAAYLRPGNPYAGGTLARDIKYLINLQNRYAASGCLFRAIDKSNRNHYSWAQRQLIHALGTLKQKHIALLGLSYKPGTNALRRTWALDLAVYLMQQGSSVVGYDPQVRALPDSFKINLKLEHSLPKAILKADAVVITTTHPSFLRLSLQTLSHMRRIIIVDPNGLLREKIASMACSMQYYAVGFRKLIDHE